MFFGELSHISEIRFPNLPAITACHGSPNKVNEKLLPDDENTIRILGNSPNAYILCGHTHIQDKIDYHGKCVINPGSVGISWHGKGKAQFVILNGINNLWTNTFISLEYDVETVINDLQVSGLSVKAPYWCKVTENLLRTGEISHSSVLARAMILCEEEQGKCNWPNIPEIYWERAVLEILGSCI